MLAVVEAGKVAGAGESGGTVTVIAEEGFRTLCFAVGEQAHQRQQNAVQNL